MNWEKRGQTTLFIIIGIVVLLSVGMYMYTSTTTVVDQSQERVQDFVEDIPVAGAPMHNFVKSCVELVATDAVKQVAQNGGYIDPMNMAYHEESSKSLVVNPFFPHKGEGFEFSPDSGIIIPYWHFYHDECYVKTQCDSLSMAPFIHSAEDPQYSVESQLQNYIGQNMAGCLNNFTDYVDQGYEIEYLDEMEVKVHLHERDVLVLLSYPIRVSRGSDSFLLNNYQTRLDVRLKALLEYGMEIAEFQTRHLFFEQNTMGFINSYSGVERDLLPPTYGTASELGARMFWIRSEVAKRLGEVLQSYMPFFRVSNARNRDLVIPSTAYSTAIYERMVMPLHVDVYEDEDVLETMDKLDSYVPFDVYFRYLSMWPMHLDITGSGARGEFISPYSASPQFNMLKFFEHQEYQFYYDVSYPVLVEVNDPFAFNGEGLKLNFGLEVNLLKNHQNVGDVLDESGEKITRGSGYGSMLCNYNQRNSDQITVFTYDKLTGEPLDRVLLNYGCGELCDVGFTQLTQVGEISTQVESYAQFRLPSCVGGQLHAIKRGYAGEVLSLDVTEGQPVDPISMELYPLKELRLDVRKHMNRQVGFTTDGADRHTWTLEKVPRKLDDYDLSLVMLERRTESPYEEERPNIVLFNTSMDEEPLIQVSPGVYDVTIFTTEVRPKFIIEPRWWCRKDVHENKCNQYNYTIPSDTSAENIIGNILTLGLQNSPCGIAIESGNMEAIELSCQHCSEITTCDLVPMTEINKTFYKGDVEFEWVVTDDIYEYNTATFHTITSPDGFEYNPENNLTNLVPEDLKMIGEVEELIKENADLLRVELSNQYIQE